MKIVKARIRVYDANDGVVDVVRAMLELYPIDKEIIKETTGEESEHGTHEFVFHMHEQDLGLLQHDIELLRICGIDIRRARS